ncbi:MAG TPA: hypothetical protein VM165_24150 [Planctomycetaceae bacterium]|nr:hypothetical protein [Planctomycetaceae bacterium]
MTPRPTYIIRGWGEYFENAQSRKYDKLTWVRMPNKHDGKSFRRLLRMADGLTMYGAWGLIVQVASKCPERGVLADADGPLSAEDISLKCDAPTELVERALQILSSPEIGWLTTAPLLADYHPTGSTLPADAHDAPAVSRAAPHRQGRPRQTEADRDKADEGKADGSARKKSALKAADLKDTGKVIGWLTSNAKRLKLDPENFDAQIHTLAAAECALEEGDNPAALFQHLMKTGASGEGWGHKDHHHEAAKRRLRAFRPVKPIAAVASLASKLGANANA